MGPPFLDHPGLILFGMSNSFKLDLPIHPSPFLLRASISSTNFTASWLSFWLKSERDAPC